MLDREPFLRTIFANPADDLPRLVFADWLDDHGDPAWAELIRVQCELTHTLPSVERLKVLSAREEELILQLRPWLTAQHDRPDSIDWLVRGFAQGYEIKAGVDLLQNPESFRLAGCSHFPSWYVSTRFTLTRGSISEPAEVHTLLTSPVTEYVTDLSLQGQRELVYDEFDDPDESESRLVPAITPSMVSILVHSREAQRITVLDLQNNDLDNDALRALAESPHLARLERLYLYEGNSFRSREWQQVLERFGPDVLRTW